MRDGEQRETMVEALGTGHLRSRPIKRSLKEIICGEEKNLRIGPKAVVSRRKEWSECKTLQRGQAGILRYVCVWVHVILVRAVVTQ